MDTTELKKMVSTYIYDIDKRVSTIESNNKKLENWLNLRKSVTQNVQQTDENVLKEMVGYFGVGCLKALIKEVSGDFIKHFENEVTAQSCDLKMIVKRD